MGFKFFLFGGVFVCFVATVLGLQCFQCGMYNEGVGSITPCLNETLMKLIECPKKEHKFCIKYISEGSTVKDCVPKCSDRENWHSMTYCCNEDACNSAPITPFQSLLQCFLAGAILLINMVH
ncbi:uncharacterized protein LOC130443227 [Diorhabda sublineata]|uniref:uncharacterized protein LOC130443227 n=1 Tax=Diorhabda sublineata TaxID=1163346 RepID=UPI0024E15F79|nr:uncharacterized protein LOC130443227 [Diorhabda sublineata]